MLKLEALASNGIRHPSFLDREINAYLRIQKKNLTADDAAGMLINPGADGAGDIFEQEDKDDWMTGCMVHTTTLFSTTIIWRT
jgi:hypothetical protein